MKKVFLAAVLCLSAAMVVNAQSSIKETFDSNSLGWTESNYEDNSGTAVIDKGVLTITSKGENKAMGALLSAVAGAAVQVGSNTYFETHCYAPLDVRKPFTIRTKVNIQKLGSERLVGLIINYKDDGNFYVFVFNDDQVRFMRYVNNGLVGSINQGVKWDKKKKLDQEWVLDYDGDALRFSVDGMEILYVRYMEMTYAGTGFYTYGKQTLVVDEIEFVQ